MEVSRRNFLVGAGVAAAGAVAAAGLAGCSDESGSSSSSSSSSVDPVENPTDTSAWLPDPPNITVDDCGETVEADVVVVGSAMGGAHAAYGAMKSGADVVVIERNGSPHISGCHVAFVNSDWQLANGQEEIDPQVVINKVLNDTQRRADCSLISLWACHSGEVLDDIMTNVFEPAGYEDGEVELWDFEYADLDQYLSLGMKFGSSRDDSLEPYLTNMHNWILDNGGRIDYDTCGRLLVQDDDGTVTGVIATNPDGDYVYYKANNGVIVCTGSYGANEAMVNYFCYPWMARFVSKYRMYNPRATETAPITTDEEMDDGTGHEMLCWAGAIMEQIDPSYQFSDYGEDSFPGDTLEVDYAGRRFRNEAVESLESGYYFFDLPDGNNGAWQILGKDDFPWPAKHRGTPQDPDEVWEEAEALEHYSADTLDELAEMINIDAEALKETVDRYNQMAEQGFDEDFGKPAKHLDTIESPYYAFWKSFVFECTYSGVKCNRYMQVVDKNWDPIPHLYAAGNTVGWRMGSGTSPHISGLGNAMAATHGYFAGQHCANGDGRPA